jgi:hypothetical protein
MKRLTTKAELMAEIESAWKALNAVLEKLTEEQMSGRRDAHGWSIKDHVLHLQLWERSVISMLTGRPRHEGLGVEEDLYLQGVDDEINDVIYRQYKALPPGETMARLRDTHQQLMSLLPPLTDADLLAPYRRYLPDEPGEGEGPPAINVIYDNTAHHFAEHLSWIEALIS